MCCATPAMLRRTSRLTGAPVGALIWVGAGGLLTMLLFIKEPLATRAVAISLAYGADLIIVAYILVVIAAIIFTIRQRMSPITTVILLIGLGRPGLHRQGDLYPDPSRSLQLGRAGGRYHVGRRDWPAIRLPAVAARRRKLASAQSRYRCAVG
jgi:hypothetical protein